MRAARVVRRTGPSGVEVRQVPVPRPADGEVLVEVRAAGVTFPDLLLSHGRYQETPDLPFGLGGEFAGVVCEAPRGAPFAVGDPVVCSSAFRGFAEFAAVPVGQVLPLPVDVAFPHAACLPSNYLTMTFGLLRRGRMRRGETVLVHGASGGLGIAAMQLATAFGGRVIAVTSAPLERILASVGYAPDHVVPEDGFPEAVAELTGGRGVDIVVDPVGNDRLERSLRCLAPFGRALVLGFAGGEIPTLSTDRLFPLDVDIVGVGWGAFLASEPDQMRAEWERLLPLVECGVARPPIDRLMPLEEAAEALALLESRSARGRLVLTP
ncbi:NADPH:quinone oxidoreductase family protein [Phytohabitans kaempferiae]|uniref:NADPH:quinone oxidoreductase family protein n=1 Tax=Phytohabitans kaempferiae TaxID=1620943 RepID=A0ABV6M634_9ACTN